MTQTTLQSFKSASKLAENGSGNKPDLKGAMDVAAWWNTDAEGNTYLSVKLGDRIKLLPNSEKQEQA